MEIERLLLSSVESEEASKRCPLTRQREGAASSCCPEDDDVVF